MGRGRGGGLRWMALREGTGLGIDSGSGCGSGRRAVQRSDLVKQDPAYSRPAASKCQTLEDGQKLSLSPHQHDSCMVLLRHQPPLIFGLWSKVCTQVTLSYTQIPLAITHGSACHTDLQTKVTSFIHHLKECTGRIELATERCPSSSLCPLGHGIPDSQIILPNIYILS